MNVYKYDPEVKRVLQDIFQIYGFLGFSRNLNLASPRELVPSSHALFSCEYSRYKPFLKVFLFFAMIPQ